MQALLLQNKPFFDTAILKDAVVQVNPISDLCHLRIATKPEPQKKINKILNNNQQTQFIPNNNNFYTITSNKLLLQAGILL